MNWIDKLEKKFGRYAIHNLMYYVIMLYGLGYVINLMAPKFYLGYLSLDPTAILRGQIWRIVTFIIYPPSTGLFFFLGMKGVRRYTPKEVHRRQAYARSVQQGAKKATVHKCAVCGRTEKDGDDLVFRYCSKCNGNYEYCQDHLFTHEHVK